MTCIYTMTHGYSKLLRMANKLSLPDRPRYRMFIDDTGDVKNIASNDPQQRFAGITGVIFEWNYLHETFEPGLLALKERHFGLNDRKRPPILHLRQIKRSVGAFVCLRDAKAREKWHQDCLRMYETAQYHVISVGVDKIDFFHSYPNWDGSIYKLLVGNAIERFFYFLRARGYGDVMAEAINKDMDQDLRGLYRGFYEGGTEHIPSSELQKVLSSAEIKIQPKDADEQGLQMADMLASTCFSHLRRVYADGPAFNAFAMQVSDIIETKKFYRDSTGNPHRYGRIWRP